MQYLGGKSRIKRPISNIINKNKRDRFYSLFVGAASVESLVEIDDKTLNDSHKYLIEMYKNMQRGWLPPETVSKEEYYAIKSNQDKDMALSGFVGFACSFGGKWWGGYARNNSGTNYAAQSRRSLLKKWDGISLAKFYSLDYQCVPVHKNSVIYCDPPYANTTRYSNSKGFDYGVFWNYMRLLSEENLVFISEISAPSDFVPVWEKPFKRSLDVNKKNIFESVEKLYVHKSKERVVNV